MESPPPLRQAPSSPTIPRLEDNAAEDLLKLFKLLGDETRLRILHALSQTEELNVRTLCRHLGQSQPAVSHHLALLREAELIAPRKDGKHNYYRVLPERLSELRRRIGQISSAIASPS